MTYNSLMNDGATLIGVVAGIRFYEHPVFGDEAPLVATRNGRILRDYEYWDMPTVEELAEFRK